MATRKYNWIIKVVCDLFLVFLVYLPWIILQTQQPIKRGFFCGDTSLSYPFKESTVPSALYVGLSIALPLLTIITVEVISYHITKKKGKYQMPTMKEENEKVYQIGKHEIPQVVVWCYCNILYFLLGAAINQTVTNIAKYSLGRLRPHFFVVCEPDYTSFRCEDNIGNPQYVTEYVCLGTHARRLKQMRLSFPSGHSSLTTYSAVFMVLYLHSRMTWKHLQTLRTVLQGGLVFGATAVCVTRISDYKHHWSDVVAGVLLGLVVATSISVYVAKFFQGPSIQSLMKLINAKLGNQSELPTTVTSQIASNTVKRYDGSHPQILSHPSQPSSDWHPTNYINPTERPKIDTFTGSGALV